MALVKFTVSGQPDPPLEDGEYLRCRGCNVTFYGADLDDLLQDGLGKPACPKCPVDELAYKGFTRHNVEADQTERSLAARWGGDAASPFTALPDALVIHTSDLGLDSRAVHVLLLMEQHRRAAGEAVWPSVRRLAVLSGQDQQTVRDRINKMERQGLIEVTEHRRSDGSQSTNRYTRDGLQMAVNHIAGNKKRQRKATDGLPELLAKLSAVGRRRQEQRTGRRDGRPQ